MDFLTYKGFKIIGDHKHYVVCPWGFPLPKAEILRIESKEFTSIVSAQLFIDQVLKSSKNSKFKFWERAKCRNTLRRTSPGVKKLLKKYPNFIKVRRYVDPKSEECRRTVEIEIET